MEIPAIVSSLSSCTCALFNHWFICAAGNYMGHKYTTEAYHRHRSSWSIDMYTVGEIIAIDGGCNGSRQFGHLQSSNIKVKSIRFDAIRFLVDDVKINFDFRRIPILGKHSKRITCGAWSRDNILALGSDDKTLSLSSEDGDSLRVVQLRDVPSDMCFAEIKTDERVPGENTVSAEFSWRPSPNFYFSHFRLSLHR